MYYKAIKTKLKLNNYQATLMAKHAGFSRWVYMAYRNIGFRELDAILQALLHESIASMGWWALNQPIDFGPF